MCKVLPKVITQVRRAATLVELQHHISSIRGRPLLDGSRQRLCTSQEEEKHTPCSGKTLAQTKREQCWRYDPTIKYEALRQYAVPRFAYDSSDWSESSDCEVENVYMSAKEVENLKDKIHVVTKEEQIVGTEEEQLFCYDPSIKYKPLDTRRIVPKFAFSDTSSTDWSDSLNSESETEAMAEEATWQNEKILARTRVEQLFCNDLAKSPSTNFESAAKDFTNSPSTNLQSKSMVKHGAKNPEEGGVKDSKRGKNMDQ